MPTGVQKKRGRPKGHSRQVLARARVVGVCRGAFADEVILGGIDPDELPSSTLPAKERHRLIRKKLNRWEAPLGRGSLDSKSQQEVGYVLRDVGEDWIAITREPGWSTDIEESPAEMERTARQLERQAHAVQISEHVGSLAIPRPRDVPGYCRLVEGKVAVLRERAERVRAAELAARESPVRRLKMDELTPADRRRLHLSD